MVIDMNLCEKEFDYLDKVMLDGPVTLSFQPPPVTIELRPGMKFEDIVQEHQKQAKDAACRGLTSLLDQVDDHIRTKRERGLFHNGHFETKKILLWCGEADYRRRVYTDREDNTRYLADELLGLEKAQAVSLDVLLRALTLAGEASYRKVASLIENWTGVRRAPETYRRWVLRVGRFIREQEKAQRFLMFKEPSLLAEDERKAPEFLFLEADGCHIFLRDDDAAMDALTALVTGQSDGEKQKSVSKKEVYLGLWYEGKRPRRGTCGNGQWEVTGKTYFGGFGDVEEFWDLAAVLGHMRYGLGPDTMVLGNGDGGLWIGPRYDDFARHLFVLCRYHWKRDVFRSFPGEEGRKLIAIVESNEKEKIIKILDEALLACSEKDAKKSKKITKLKTYLLNQWEEIQNYAKLKEFLRGKDPALARVGVIEGHIYQVLYLRFESRGGCWSTDGLNSLFRVLTAKLNGVLDGLIRSAGWNGLLKTWVPPVKEQAKRKKRVATGCTEGLFPILQGPIGKPIAQALKSISHPVSPALALR